MLKPGWKLFYIHNDVFCFMEEDTLLRLELLEGNEEGCAETLGVADGELEGSADGSDEGPKKARCSN